MKRIRNRVFVQILVPTVVVYCVVVVGGLWVIDRSFRQEILAQKNAELENASRALDNWLTDRISNLIQIAHTPLLAGDDSARILEFLGREQERLAFIYSRFVFVQPDGRYASTDGLTGELPPDHVLRSVWRDDRLFLYDGPILDDPVFGNSVLIASPVLEDGTDGPIVAAAVPLDTFRRVVRYFTIDGFSSFTMVNARSTIITDADEDLKGMREVEHFGREFSENAELGGELAFVSVLRTTWKLIAFAPKGEVFSQIAQINRVAILFFVAVIFIIGISSLVVSNAVVSPIRRLTAGVHRLSAGNYRGQIEVSTDDELRELADAFNRFADRLADRRRDDQFVFLGHFAARMAHEMRKPLHIAQLAAQALRSRESYSEKHVGMIEREIENADRFICEILNFGRPEQLDLTEYSLAELIEKVLAEHELVMEEEGITLHAEIDHEVPPMYMDILKMEQVMSNLLQNAIEATNEDGGEPWVVVRLRTAEDGAVELAVTDGGPGFDEETKERAMDPYFTSKDSGTGLGLSICYRILAAHGAALRLENTEAGTGRVRVRFRV